MKKRDLLLSLLAVFSVGVHSVSALEVEDGYQKVDSGTASVSVDKIADYEKELFARVEELNLSSIVFNLNELYRYRMEVEGNDEAENYKKISNEKSFESEKEAEEWALSNEPEEKGWSLVQNIIKAFKIDKIFSMTTYETKAEAIVAKDKFDSSVDSDSEKAVITEVRDEADDKSATVIRDEKYYELRDAENAANQLLVDNHDFKVVATVIKGDSEYDKTVSEEITLTEYFETLDAAQEYICNLEKEGYTVINPSIVPIVHQEKIAELHQDNYTSMEEAQGAYQQFVNENQNATITGDGVTSRLNPDKNVVGELVAGMEAYSSLDEAQAALENLTDNVEGVIRKDSRLIEEKVFGSEEGQIQKVFDSELEAINYIESLKNQGYDVSNLEKELVSFEESRWENQEGVEVDPGTSDGQVFKYGHFDITLITSFTKIDENGNKSTVNGSITVSSVKINDKTITMKNPTRDPNTGRTEYTSSERNNLNVTNKSLVEITGTVTFEGKTLPFTVVGYLSESQNVCGGRGNSKGYDLEFESITILNNKVLVDANVVNQYKIVGTATKTVDAWYVDTKTTILGYDYVVNADAYEEVVDGYNIIGTKSIDLYKDVYQVKVETTEKDYDYQVSGTGVKTYYDVISEYVRLVDIDWIIEFLSFGKGGDMAVVEVLPPQTGVNGTDRMAFNLFTAIIACLIVGVKKFI